MRKTILYISMLFVLAGCSLNNLEPAQTRAFMKYFGEDGNTRGVALLKLDDGYLLLGNNTSKQDIPSALLIKVDLNGNLLWANQFDQIKGSALAKSATGYFIVGDSIDTSNPLSFSTRMSLIKTDLNGGDPTYVSISGNNVLYHGTGVAVTALNEVVIIGYTEDHVNNIYETFIHGYDENLSPTWTLRKWSYNGAQAISSSNTLVETDEGDFMWTTLVSNGTNSELHINYVGRDSGSPKDGQVLLDQYTLTDLIGGFNNTLSGGVFVQSTTNPSAIALGTYSNLVEQPSALITEEGYKLFGQAVIQSNGEFVILGATDKHLDGSTTRSDLDFYITRVSPFGELNPTTGFTNIIGGTGNESGVALVEADDGGYVFLGTMKNTNEVELMVLVKITHEGELIN